MSRSIRIWTEIIPAPKAGAMTKLGDTPLFVFVYNHYTHDWNHCQEVAQEE